MNFKKIISGFLAVMAAVSFVPVQSSATETEAKEPSIILTLDPGHGYNSEEKSYTGATGAMTWGGVQEDLYNWEITQHCKSRLEEYGALVYLTKSNVDDNPSFDNRVYPSAKNDSVALISIHNNSSSKNTARGTQIYTVNPNYDNEMYQNSVALANAIMKRLNEDAGTHKNCDPYYVNSKTGSTHPDGSIQEYYALLWRSKRCSKNVRRGSELMAAMIVECVFQSNESDVKNFLLKPEKLEAMGIAIADGIADHYGLKLLSEIDGETTDTTALAETTVADNSSAVEESNVAVTDKDGGENGESGFKSEYIIMAACAVVILASAFICIMMLKKKPAVPTSTEDKTVGETENISEQNVEKSDDNADKTNEND